MTTFENKKRGGYLFIAAGCLFLTAGYMGNQVAFGGVGIAFLAIGASHAFKSKNMPKGS